MYEAWFASIEDRDWFEATEARTFQELLSGQATPEAAARKLAEPSPTRSENANNKLWRLWTMIFNGASDLPGGHGAMVDLLKAFRELVDVHHKYGQTTIIWPDLPRFDNLWRDKIDSLEAWRDGSASGAQAQLVKPAQQWINFNAFSARLCAAAIGDSDPVWGFFTIRDALEVQPASHTSDMDICAASQWIVYAGATIYETDNKMINDHWKDALAKETALWKGAPGFSRKRWTVWKGRFEELKKSDSVTDAVKTSAREAFIEMEAIERRHKH